MLRLIYISSARLCGRKNYRLQDIQLSKSWKRWPGVYTVTTVERHFRGGFSPNSGTPEPSSPGAASIRSPSLEGFHLAAGFHRAKTGGEYRARTGDLLVANQALSQLS